MDGQRVTSGQVEGIWVVQNRTCGEKGTRMLDAIRESDGLRATLREDMCCSVKEFAGPQTLRRSRIDLITPVEKMLYDAVWEVEKLGAHILLTDAVTLLQKAREKVADWIEIPKK